MIGTWTLFLSIAVTIVAAAGVYLAFRSRHRIAIVLSVDAVVVAVLGIVLISATRGEFDLIDLLIFVALPVALEIASAILSRRGLLGLS